MTRADSSRAPSPVQGFGRMRQTTYRIRLAGLGVPPEEIAQGWKTRFAPVQAGPPVLYADDTSLLVMTPRGHQLAGFNRFNVRQDGDDVIAEVTSLVRASDPLSELGLAVGILQPMQDRAWRRVLRGLAAEFGATEPPSIELRRVVVDQRRQWRQWRNLRHNAVLCSAASAAAGPWRWLRARPAQTQTAS